MTGSTGTLHGIPTSAWRGVGNGWAPAREPHPTAAARRRRRIIHTPRTARARPLTSAPSRRHLPAPRRPGAADPTTTGPETRTANRHAGRKPIARADRATWALRLVG